MRKIIRHAFHTSQPAIERSSKLRWPLGYYGLATLRGAVIVPLVRFPCASQGRIQTSLSANRVLERDFATKYKTRLKVLVVPSSAFTKTYPKTSPSDIEFLASTPVASIIATIVLYG